MECFLGFAKLSAFHYLLLQQPCIYCEKVTQKLMNLMLSQTALVLWDRNFHETLQGSSCKVSWTCSKKGIVSKSWSKSVPFHRQLALLSFPQKYGARVLNGIISKGKLQQCLEPVTEVLQPCSYTEQSYSLPGFNCSRGLPISTGSTFLMHDIQGFFHRFIILEDWIHDLYR